MKLLRWTGSKTKLISAIIENLPQKFIQDETIPFVEPFVGGMAVIMGLIDHDIISEQRPVFLYDGNKELINFYKIVRDNPEKLIHRMNKIFSTPITKEKYLELRDEYNSLIVEEKILPIKSASLFMFLNITGFNGIYLIFF